MILTTDNYPNFECLDCRRKLKEPNNQNSDHPTGRPQCEILNTQTTHTHMQNKHTPIFIFFYLQWQVLSRSTQYKRKTANNSNWARAERQ